MSDETILRNAYRLGNLDMILTMNKNGEYPLPGVIRQSFEGEQAERLTQLIAECGEGDWTLIRIGEEER
jgi:hypothetical protein